MIKRLVAVGKIDDLDETMDKAEVDQVTQKSYINDKKEDIGNFHMKKY